MLLSSSSAAFHNRPKLIPQATALVTFAQLVGGVVGISIAGTLFNNEIKSQLAQRGVSSEVTAGESFAPTLIRIDRSI